MSLLAVGVKRRDKVETYTERCIKRLGDVEYDHQSLIGTQHLPTISHTPYFISSHSLQIYISR